MDEKVIQAGMFNNRSTGSERRELLQSILRADDQEEEEENEAPDDETINQVCSRSVQSGFKTGSLSKRFAFWAIKACRCLQWCRFKQWITVEEQMPHQQKVVGSIPAWRWAFFCLFPFRLVKISSFLNQPNEMPLYFYEVKEK